MALFRNIGPGQCLDLLASALRQKRWPWLGLEVTWAKQRSRPNV